MKVLCIINSGQSGSDVYFERLKQGLEKYTDFKVELVYVPQFFEKVPFLIPLYTRYLKIDFSEYDILHANVDFAHYFKIRNKPLVSTIFHSVFDNDYGKHTSLLQKA